MQKEGCGGWGVSSNSRLISPRPATANTDADRLGNTLPRERCASALRLDPCVCNVQYLVHTALSHTHTHTAPHEDATHRTRLLTDACSHTRAIPRRRRVHLANSYQPPKKTLVKNKKKPQTLNIQPGRKDDPSSAQLFTPL